MDLSGSVTVVERFTIDDVPGHIAISRMARSKSTTAGYTYQCEEFYAINPAGLMFKGTQRRIAEFFDISQETVSNTKWKDGVKKIHSFGKTHLTIYKKDEAKDIPELFHHFEELRS